MKALVDGWKATAEHALGEQAVLNAQLIVLRDQICTAALCVAFTKRILAAWPVPDQKDIEGLQLQIDKWDTMLTEVEGSIGRQPVQGRAADASSAAAREDVAAAVRGDSGPVGVVAQEDLRGGV